MSSNPGIEIRAATDDDQPAILAMLRASLGWDDDTRFEALFSWKHRENPFGRSAGWLAHDGNRLVGVRLLMRWEFEAGGVVRRAARAVDTATHPEYRGHGIFTGLTRHAIDDLRREQVSFVFNTPNDQSRPGYLKMGWRVVGRLPVAVRPTSAGAVVRMLRARTPAARWSSTSSAGEPARDVLADRDDLETLLAARSHVGALSTRLTADYLRWRYASDPIDYRAVTGPEGVRSGLAVFRARRRGATSETVLCTVVTPTGDASARRELLHRVVRAADTDYVLAIESKTVSTGGFVRLPGQGPVLTARPLDGATVPAIAGWGLHLGDVELF